MRRIYKFLLLLLLVAATPAHAQHDEQAMAAAIDTIVRVYHNPSDSNSIVNMIVEDMFKKHGKTAYLATRIAKSYFKYAVNPETHIYYYTVDDTLNAFKYINRAIAIDPKYPDSYVFASDIIRVKKGSSAVDESMAWLNRGITQNPTDESLYIASSNLLAYSDPDGAADKLRALKDRNPSFLVDLHLARLYFNIYDRGGTREEQLAKVEKMAYHYGLTPIDTMNAGDLGAYAMALLYSEELDNQTKFQKCYDATNYGIQKFPEDMAIRQYHFSSLVGLGRWDEAIASAQKMFLISDSTKLNPSHYLQYGEALENMKQYDEALKQYEYVLSLKGVSDRNQRIANSHIERTMQSKTNDLIKEGHFDQAIKLYSTFVDDQRAKGRLTVSALDVYAKIYMEQAEKQEEEKENTYMKADKVYADMLVDFPENDDYAIYQRYKIRKNLDPENERGISVPFAEQLVTVTLSKDDLDKNQYRRNRLREAYWTLCYNYATTQKNPRMAIVYADKILEIEPEHAQAKKVLEMFSKYRR